MRVLLKSTKTSTVYEVIKFDPDTQEATLKKQANYPVQPFKIRPFNKARVEKDGYMLVKEA
jgi:hypothetical protein